MQSNLYFQINDNPPVLFSTLTGDVPLSLTFVNRKTPNTEDKVVESHLVCTDAQGNTFKIYAVNTERELIVDEYFDSYDINNCGEILTNDEVDVNSLDLSKARLKNIGMAPYEALVEVLDIDDKQVVLSETYEYVADDGTTFLVASDVFPWFTDINENRSAYVHIPLKAD